MNDHTIATSLRELERKEAEHAKLEAANKVLREALDKIANCKQGNVVKYIQTVDALALDAIDTADEIMKENG